MEILRYLLLVIEVFCSLALIALILVQRSKSEGLGLAFGTGMGETLFGARTGNILTRLTIIFSIVFMANTLGLSILYAGQRTSSIMSRVAVPSPVARPTAAPPPGPVKEEEMTPLPSGAPTLPGAEFSAGEAAEAPPPASE